MNSHCCKEWACGKVRPRAQWEGSNTIHCSYCGELFLSSFAYDTHMVGDDLGCADPGSFKNADGTPLFQRIKRPTWTPNYAWTYITVVTL